MLLSFHGTLPNSCRQCRERNSESLVLSARVLHLMQENASNLVFDQKSTKKQTKQKILTKIQPKPTKLFTWPAKWMDSSCKWIVSSEVGKPNWGCVWALKLRYEVNQHISVLSCLRDWQIITHILRCAVKLNYSILLVLRSLKVLEVLLMIILTVLPVTINLFQVTILARPRQDSRYFWI